MKNKDEEIRSLRDFPSVEVLSGEKIYTRHIEILSKPVVTEIIKRVILEQKDIFKKKNIVTAGSLRQAVKKALDKIIVGSLTRVINGTGIIVHTNLGRAPLSRKMIESAISATTGYSNLEFDLTTGRRGKRGQFIELLLSTLCHTEAATLVNNNAAALYLILNTLANRKEVIISRGELVQIGGGFKIPDIMARSGAKLVEVGTTNQTRIEDYETAVGDRARLILKVHRSNFTQVGFVNDTPLEQLSHLAKDKGLILVNDLGSGLIEFPRGVKISDEPRVFDSVKNDVDITCFSGDKLLGGPQAGLIVGREALIAKMKKNPLFRTFRCDKIVFHLMAQVLLSYLHGRQFTDLPVWNMITIPEGELKTRGEAIINKCRGKDIVLEASEAYLGGGSTPSQTIPSLSLSIRSKQKANALAKRFREFDPAIIGRVNDENFLIDLRTVATEDDKVLIAAIKALVS